MFVQKPADYAYYSENTFLRFCCFTEQSDSYILICICTIIALLIVIENTHTNTSVASYQLLTAGLGLSH